VVGTGLVEENLFEQEVVYRSRECEEWDRAGGIVEVLGLGLVDPGLCRKAPGRSGATDQAMMVVEDIGVVVVAPECNIFGYSAGAVGLGLDSLHHSFELDDRMVDFATLIDPTSSHSLFST